MLPTHTWFRSIVAAVAALTFLTATASDPSPPAAAADAPTADSDRADARSSQTTPTLAKAEVRPARMAQDALVTREMKFCASLGPKAPGLRSGVRYSKYLARKFAQAGLETRTETFHLPRYDVSSESIDVVGAGAGRVPGEAFAYSGTGTVTGDVVDLGIGRAADYAGKDVRGKIVMVNRDTAFHRTAQLTEVIKHGGAAMLYISGVPDNLVQTGTVRFAQDKPSPIPAMTVGKVDGARLRNQLEAGQLRMRLHVDAKRVDAIGRNVIGVKVGTTYPNKYIVVGGHYDNWHAGAVDNCSSMGSMLQMLHDTRGFKPAYTVIFGAWDAEEIGLTGSYDFVRRHPRIIDNTVVNENLEMTSAATYLSDTQLPVSLLNLMFGTSNPAMNAVALGAAARAGFTPVPVPATVVRGISGGIIPTDLQPFYSRGVQGFSTFSESPYYHTTEESPDKIDAPSHVRVTNFLTNVLLDLQVVPPAALQTREVPYLTIKAPKRRTPGRGFRAVVTLLNTARQPINDAQVQVLVNQRDHWAVMSGKATSLGNGRYLYRVPAKALRRYRGATWLTATVDTTDYRAEGYARVAAPQQRR